MAGLDLEGILGDFVGEAPGGAVVFIMRHGQFAAAAIGDANADGTPLTRETPFRVGSISKTFVATMILQLVDEGTIDLDEPLGAYLPDVPLGADVTIRQLLSHRSGLPNYTDDPEFFLAILDDFSRSYEPAEILEFVTDNPIEPAGTFAYCNTNYILLGMLLEQVEGASLNDVLQNRIAGPLGLANTLFVGRGVADPADLASFWSIGLNTGLTPVNYESVASSAWAAGGLVSTVDDLDAFLLSLFEGDLISAAALTEMTDTGSSGYGLGLFTAQLGAGNPGFAHNGSTPGYSSTMGIAPASGDVIVVLTNNDNLVADALAQMIVTEW
jgi:D-alanyl-D-alanine carboxypeptidase